VKKMNLLSLKLTYFKGAKSFFFEPDGKDTDVYGDNATGKTTLKDAATWLLYGKDSQGKADFGIKTLDDGVVIPKIDHEVEGIFQIDGKLMTLKKVYHETWTRKRGAKEETFTGHTTDHFINDVPIQEKEWNAKIGQIAPEEVFMMLTSPTFFNSMEWKKQREALIAVCGDVPDADVIAGNPDLKDLASILEDRTADEHRKVAEAGMKKANKAIKDIPVRIDQITKDMPEVEGDPVIIKQEVDAVLAEVNEKQQAVVRAENGGEISDIKKKISEAETSLQKAKTAHQVLIDETVKMRRTELTEIGAEQMNKKRALGELYEESNVIAKALSAGVVFDTDLRNQYAAIQKEEFTFSCDDTCPTCNQAIPKERIESALNIAVSDFNESRNKRAEEINQKGRDNSAKMKELTAQNEELDKKISVAEKEVAGLEGKYNQKEKEIKAMIDEAPGLEDMEDYKTATAAIKALSEKLTAAESDNLSVVDKYKEEVKSLNEKLSEKQSLLLSLESKAKMQESIADLEKQETDLSVKYSQLENEIYMLDTFLRDKVNMLNDKVNDQFSIVRFNLFKQQINGGLKETCECTVDGVPFSDLNSAAEIQAGLDIINTLTRHYQFMPPVFIDKRESVTSIPEMEAQVINLRVSKPDKELRVEVHY